MASSLHKFLRRSLPAARPPAVRNHLQPPPCLFTRRSPAIVEPPQSLPNIPLLNPFLGLIRNESAAPSNFSPPAFPSFPFWLCSQPILPAPSIDCEAGFTESSDSNVVWADSVKKKRKKKMNKHKLKKLRKRMRRKT